MAPTVLRTKNLRVVIYPKDHFPPHVHVYGPDAEAKFDLEEFSCFYSRGFSDRAIREIGAFLKERKEILLEAWNEYQE